MRKVAQSLEGGGSRRWFPPTHAMALAVEAHKLERRRGRVVAALGACGLDEGLDLSEGDVDIRRTVKDQQGRRELGHVGLRRAILGARSDRGFIDPAAHQRVIVVAHLRVALLAEPVRDPRARHATGEGLSPPAS